MLSLEVLSVLLHRQTEQSKTGIEAQRILGTLVNPSFSRIFRIYLNFSVKPTYSEQNSMSKVMLTLSHICINTPRKY